MRLIENRKRGFWRWQPIPNPEGAIYLLRLWLAKFRKWGLALHWIKLGDYARDMHDHPWWFVSFVIWGGYREVTPASPEGRWIKRWRFNFKRAGREGQHRIAEVLPHTITLVLRGPKVLQWGFYTKDGFVERRKYERMHYGAEL